MENYRKSSHCTYDIKYHLVWITKYRKPVIAGKIAVRTRELIRTICQRNEVEIMAGHVGTDHIHMLVSVPPHLSASKLVQLIRKASDSSNKKSRGKPALNLMISNCTRLRKYFLTIHYVIAMFRETIL